MSTATQSVNHPQYCGRWASYQYKADQPCTCGYVSRKLPRLDFHIAENAQTPACLLIEEESGLVVAQFPNSPQGIEDCMAVIKAVNSHDALVAALKGAQSALRKALPFAPPDNEGIYCGEWLDEINAALALVEGGQ